MNTKLFPAALIAAFGIAACDGNDEETPNPTPDVIGDTNTPGDADTGDGSDTAGPIDTVTPPDVVDVETSIKAARVQAQAVTCDPNGFTDVNPNFTLKEVVVTSPKFAAGGSANPTARDGYYIADKDGGAYSGMVLWVNENSRPATEYQPGDVITVSGQLKEVFCYTVLEAAATPESAGTATIAPVVVAPNELAQEAYEGMFVQVKDVTVKKTPAGNGYKFSYEPGNVTISFGAFTTGFIALNAESVYDITGVVALSYNEFALTPRYPTDAVLKSAPTNSIQGIQGSDISLTCPNPAPNFQNGVADVAIEGIIMSDRYRINDSLQGQFIADGSGSAFSGMIVTYPNTVSLDFAVGDRVKLIGDHQEYYCQTQFRVDSGEKIGTEAPQAPVVLTAPLSAETLEQYEGVLVEIHNVAVTGDDGHGAAQTDAGVLIDKTIMGSSFSAPAAGTTISKLVGFVTYNFNAFRVSPRTAADYTN